MIVRRRDVNSRPQERQASCDEGRVGVQEWVVICSLFTRIFLHARHLVGEYLVWVQPWAATSEERVISALHL